MSIKTDRYDKLKAALQVAAGRPLELSMVNDSFVVLPCCRYLFVAGRHPAPVRLFDGGGMEAVYRQAGRYAAVPVPAGWPPKHVWMALLALSAAACHRNDVCVTAGLPTQIDDVNSVTVYTPARM